MKNNAIIGRNRGKLRFGQVHDECHKFDGMTSDPIKLPEQKSGKLFSARN